MAGHELGVIRRELNYLIKKGLVISETLSETADNDDLIKIDIPGQLHLQLLKNVTYLAACAEDVLFKNAEVMTAITRRLTSNAYTSKIAMALTANDMIDYLIDYQKEFYSYADEYICEEDRVIKFDLKECKEVIMKWIQDDPQVREQYAAIKTYSIGTEINVRVAYKTYNGIMCFFGDNHFFKGFIRLNDRQSLLTYSAHIVINEGDILNCEILNFDFKHSNFQLKFISREE